LQIRPAPDQSWQAGAVEGVEFVAVCAFAAEVGQGYWGDYSLCFVMLLIVPVLIRDVWNSAQKDRSHVVDVREMLDAPEAEPREERNSVGKNQKIGVH
jgi:hypothetical protein